MFLILSMQCIFANRWSTIITGGYPGKTGPRYCGIFNYVITVCNVDHVIIGQLPPRGRQVDKEGKNDISASSTANEESIVTIVKWVYSKFPQLV